MFPSLNFQNFRVESISIRAYPLRFVGPIFSLHLKSVDDNRADFHSRAQFLMKSRPNRPKSSMKRCMTAFLEKAVSRSVQLAVCEKYLLNEQLLETGVPCHTLLYRQIPRKYIT